MTINVVFVVIKTGLWGNVKIEKVFIKVKKIKVGDKNDKKEGIC